VELNVDGPTALRRETLSIYTTSVKRFAVTSARLFGGSIGIMRWCCQKTVGPPFGQLLCPHPIALCPYQNTELAPFDAATPLVTPFVRLISVAVQPNLVFLALERVDTRFPQGGYLFGFSD
jgi:hypothetical protein